MPTFSKVQHKSRDFLRTLCYINTMPTFSKVVTQKES